MSAFDPLRFLIQALIDQPDLLHPALPLDMVHPEDVFALPVEVIGEIGYLLMELIEGVA